MFSKLHLFDLDAPTGDEDFQQRTRSYLRMAGQVPKGPAEFSWNDRQLDDLEALWLDPEAEGARDRLASDLSRFADKLSWSLDASLLDEAEKHGDEYHLTISSGAAELYGLPWEVLEVGSSGTYLADYRGTLVRYAVPGLSPRFPLGVPSNPGVLFAWSAAGGHVPHEAQGDAIRAAAAAGGVSFREIAHVDNRSLQAALDDGPPSVLHLLCHGVPGAEGEPPQLTWGGGDRASSVTATRLARMLRPHRDSIRLVVLSACGSGDSALDPLFMSSLAQEIHKKGIPNVVASRYPLSVRGSKVLVRVLYDQMLRHAWSLERSLSHTRSVLFRPDDEDRIHAGDAYGIQLYAADVERFVSENGVEAERPVLASYPFGTAELPIPASRPPRKEVSIALAQDPEKEHGRKHTLALLMRFSEDKSLTYVLERGVSSYKLIVESTVDGAQRLLAAWRAQKLAQAFGFAVLGVHVASALLPPAPAAAGDSSNELTVSALFSGESQAAVRATQTGAAPAGGASATGTFATKAIVGLGGLLVLAVAAIATASALGVPLRLPGGVSAGLLPAGAAPVDTAPTTAEPEQAWSSTASSTTSATRPALEASPDELTQPAAAPERGASSGQSASEGTADELAPRAQAAAPTSATSSPEAGAEVSASALPTKAAESGDEGTPEPQPGTDASDASDVSDKSDKAPTTRAQRPRAARRERRSSPSSTASRTAPTATDRATGEQSAKEPAQPAAAPPARVRPNLSDRRYNPDTNEAVISWQPLVGAAGVIVVANDRKLAVKGPTDGERYHSGPWPHGGVAKVLPARATSSTWRVPPGESVWLTFWAFDEQLRYSGARTVKFEAPVF